eukprot:1649210-Rhodomonas_salina.1
MELAGTGHPSGCGSISKLIQVQYCQIWGKLLLVCSARHCCGRARTREPEALPASAAPLGVGAMFAAFRVRTAEPHLTFEFKHESVLVQAECNSLRCRQSWLEKVISRCSAAVPRFAPQGCCLGWHPEKKTQAVKARASEWHYASQQ